MDELINILNKNNIKYTLSKYGDEDDSIVIKKNKWKMEIYYDYENNRYVRDLQKVPYTFGEMGDTPLNEIIEELKEYLKIDIKEI